MLILAEVSFRQYMYIVYTGQLSLSVQSHSSFINKIVTLSQVLHPAQDDLLIHKTKMLDEDYSRFKYIVWTCIELRNEE